MCTNENNKQFDTEHRKLELLVSLSDDGLMSYSQTRPKSGKSRNRDIPTVQKPNTQKIQR